MKTLFVALFSLSLATSAPAATVSVDNTTYDVTMLTGTLDQKTSELLQDQVWWGDTTLAGTFAKLVGTLLGLPNSPSFGPLFATSFAKNNVKGAAFTWRVNRESVASASVNANNKNAVYAIATVVPAAVPVPAAGLLLMSALAGIAALRSRRRRIV